MSIVSTPVYKDIDGNHYNPAMSQFFNTHCDGGLAGLIPKKFHEVFIHWDDDLDVWVEDPVYIPGESIVAIRVDDPCTLGISYIQYSFNDFRLKQICCVDEQGEDDVFNNVFSEEFS